MRKEGRLILRVIREEAFEQYNGPYRAKLSATNHYYCESVVKVSYSLLSAVAEGSRAPHWLPERALASDLADVWGTQCWWEVQDVLRVAVGDEGPTGVTSDLRRLDRPEADGPTTIYMSRLQHSK